jgi:hypothetical protein
MSYLEVEYNSLNEKGWQALVSSLDDLKKDIKIPCAD